MSSFCDEDEPACNANTQTEHDPFVKLWHFTSCTIIHDDLHWLRTIHAGSYENGPINLN